MLNHWISLAAADLARTRDFYTAIGFEVGGEAPCLTVRINPQTMICFFAPEQFAGMIFGEAADPRRTQELVQSVGLDSREAVDDLIERARAAGATQVRPGQTMPFGYAGGFADPDGHVWAALWMPE